MSQPFIAPPPAGLLYWGNAALLGFIGSLIGLANWVEYPEILWAEVEILAGEAPVEVVPSASGRVIKLFYKDGESVSPDAPIAVLESDANWEAILALPEHLDRLDQLSPSDFGPIGKSLIAWQEEADRYRQYQSQSNIGERIQTLEHQIQQLSQLNVSLEQQKRTLQTIIEISLSNVARQKELIERGAASNLDLESAQAEYLELKRQQETINLSIIDNQIKKDQLQLEKLRLAQQEFEEKDRYQSRLRSLKKELLQGVEAWKTQYLLDAPIAGQIQFPNPLREQQFVEAGTSILAIIPTATRDGFTAKGSVQASNSGKIQPGMRAFIRLDGFPYEEYGQLTAEIRSIGILPQGEKYTLEMDLPNGNQTTYQRRVPLRPQLFGTARIILGKQSLLDRIVAQAKGLQQ